MRKPRKTNNIIALLVAVFVLLTCFAATTSPTATPTIKPTKAVLAQTTAALRSNDPASIAQAEIQIRTWLAAGRVPPELWHDWIPALMAAQRYQDSADLALAGALARPDPKWLGNLFSLRTKALNALDKTDDALQSAKSFYNACPMRQTPAAIDMTQLCLAKAHPDDAEIAQRFRSEQIVSTGDAPPASPSGDEPAPATRPAALLKSISIDHALYADALNVWKGRAAGGKFSDMAGYANLLLAADQGADAEKIFRQLFQIASTQDELDAATEGIARSLRAQDGNLARANAWLLSLLSGPTSQPAVSERTDSQIHQNPANPEIN